MATEFSTTEQMIDKQLQYDAPRWRMHSVAMYTSRHLKDHTAFLAWEMLRDAKFEGHHEASGALARLIAESSPHTASEALILDLASLALGRTEGFMTEEVAAVADGAQRSQMIPRERSPVG